MKDVDEILKDALKLPPEARAALAGTLFDSIDRIVDENAETMWETEILNRIKDIDNGSVKMIPWLEARRRIAGE